MPFSDGQSIAERAKVHAALVVAQLCFAGFDILCKLALSDGVSPVVFPIYRNGIAFVLLSILALILEKNNRPQLCVALLCQFFLLGITGVFLNQVLYLIGMRVTSAQFASATQNTFPAFTFILAFFCRLEKVSLKRPDGVAKVIGTILSVSGSMIMTLYKGPLLKTSGVYSKHPSDLHLHNFQVNAEDLINLDNSLSVPIEQWQIGAFCLIGASLSVSAWLILQVPVLVRYPAPLSCAAFTSFFGTIQLFIYALFVEKNPQNWVLKKGPEIIGVIYAGIFASGIYSFIQTWCNYKGGPVLVASYQPLETVFVGILGLYFCVDALHLGSLLGAILVITGLFVLTWGLGEEKRLCTLAKVKLTKISTSTDPLLV
ncbi:hypothetical protein O6H91_11G026800 [Diphasiastrum complanatum]|uniref:Uncharacterized protein n=1 Tax=Diphasiastrum complanatum TaxID=34168 RepID=A0ACC2C7R0_DIPCM|nr:hypothetical protein O6H91_11G026800 [Diphasiastrum complanatum]